MKKDQIALDFIRLYKYHKKGALLYPKPKEEENHLKEKREIRNGLKKL